MDTSSIKIADINGYATIYATDKIMVAALPTRVDLVDGSYRPYCSGTYVVQISKVDDSIYVSSFDFQGLELNSTPSTFPTIKSLDAGKLTYRSEDITTMSIANRKNYVRSLLMPLDANCPLFPASWELDIFAYSANSTRFPYAVHKAIFDTIRALDRLDDEDESPQSHYVMIEMSRIQSIASLRSVEHSLSVLCDVDDDLRTIAKPALDNATMLSRDCIIKSVSDLEDILAIKHTRCRNSYLFGEYTSMRHMRYHVERACARDHNLKPDMIDDHMHDELPDHVVAMINIRSNLLRSIAKIVAVEEADPTASSLIVSYATDYPADFQILLDKQLLEPIDNAMVKRMRKFMLAGWDEIIFHALVLNHNFQ